MTGIIVDGGRQLVAGEVGNPLASRQLLRRSDLHDQVAAGSEVSTGSRDKLFEDAIAVGATIECQVRFVVTNANGKPFDLLMRNVRRVAEDKVEYIARRDRAA